MITTIQEWILYLEQAYPNRVAFQYMDYTTGELTKITYARYAGDVRQFASYLYTIIKDPKGKHFGILAGNGYQYAVSLYGVLLAGGVAVPLNPMKRWEELDYEINCGDLCLIFHDGTFMEREPALGAAYGSILRPLTVYQACESAVEVPALYDSERLAVIMFTSGTTARCKGVMLTEKNLMAPIKAFTGVVEEVTDQPITRLFFVMPMYHIGGLVSVLVHTYLGHQINMCCQPKNIYRELKRMESDFTCIAPEILYSFYKNLKKGRVKRLNGIHSISCGSATLDTSLLALFQKYNILVSQSYGLTEMCGGGTSNKSMAAGKIRSVGQPISGVEIKIEDGEVCLRGEAMMKGYYKDPIATAQVIQNGWLHTGDLGYLDEDGYLYLTGRKKNLIILASGENINPEEVEVLISQCPEVEEVLVKEKNGRLCAEIFCAIDQQKTVANYISELNKTLALYTRVSLVEYQEQPFEKTATGKIKRKG